MKWYIPTNKLDIDIDTIFSACSDIAADTQIKPILDGNVLDSAALSDYLTFIESLEEIMYAYDFVEEDKYRSGSNPYTSFYYIYAHKQNIEDDDIPKVIRLRVSDHVQHLSKDHQDILKKKLEAKLETLKAPRSKRKQRYIPVDLIVNNQHFDSYEDALNYVEDMIFTWLEKCGVDTSKYEKFGNW